MSTDVQIRLTRKEFETLLIMAGMALGTAIKLGDTRLMVAFLKVANAINRDNPNWIHYEIPEHAGTIPSK